MRGSSSPAGYAIFAGWGFAPRTAVPITVDNRDNRPILADIFAHWIRGSNDMTEPTESDLRHHFLELEGLLDRVERASTHYQVLGVERSATGDEISLAQRRIMAVLNPQDSRHATLPADFSRKIKVTVREVVKAYMVLGNFGSRVEYDNSLVRRAPVPIPIDLGRPITERPARRPEAQAISGQPLPIQEAPAPAPVGSTASSNASPIASADRGDQDPISIKHSSAQVLFTKSVSDRKKEADKRKYQRLRLSIPTYVTGYDRTGGKWTEVAHTVDVSIGGISIQLAKDMPEGAVVHLTFPMPTKLRRHGYSDPTYQVYAIVRRIQPQDEKQHVVGLEFLGASPPPGYLQKPWAKFQTKW
jgi:curved DNA-binding protein CbpA